MEAGVDPNATDANGLTALHYAAGYLAWNVARYLVEEVDGLDATIEDVSGRLAVRVALDGNGPYGIEMSEYLEPFCFPKSQKYLDEYFKYTPDGPW